MIQGKPLAIPKQKILKKRLSLYVFIALNKILPSDAPRLGIEPCNQ
jgi:hypothetical protein